MEPSAPDRRSAGDAGSGSTVEGVAAPGQDDPAVVVNNLSFTYSGIDGQPLLNSPPIFRDVSFSLRPGSRCLLVGPNGAGKTTLLKILGGKHLVPRDCVWVLGSSPFHDTALTSSGLLSYIGGAWVRDIAFAGYSVPLQGDFPAGQIIEGIPGVDPKRRERVMKVMDINSDWRMHLVSDGQRRRVQLCVGLLKPFKVLLLDEITVDLDVLGRADLMDFLTEECEERGATIVYATHIFDGLQSWPTHVAFLADGKFQTFDEVKNVPHLRDGKLLDTVVRWLREDKRRRAASKRSSKTTVVFQQPLNNGWASGRMTASLSK
ncbi:unnamed protein product [Ostreobium quekettii]|uniref:ABC transporter domain-containing protein n=1 Tax=Ostreobium quekettii TaxID=121088 RepID=A0A8S1J6B2_9CHLO|nr:unnamed protein product [Ostreobium quekettii]|eukprot:evm.model.scf_195.15 EVM.evm.TU.scf_195.15   scf_195:105734-109252(-)